MTKELSVDDLWASATSGERVFHLDQISNLPEAARRYIAHAIVPGTRLASAVRLSMHGEIKRKRWLPFKAEQTIRWNRGMIWSATVRMHGLPIRGSDRFLDGEGTMRWKLFGVVSVMVASGPDISRSAFGRVAAEAMWLPSVLCGTDVSWRASDVSHAHARLTMMGNTTEMELAIDEQGRPKTVQLPRWGNPEGKAFRYEDFGGIVEEEDTFHGYTIPTLLRVGWYVNTPRFETDGEFFRVRIDEVTYR